MKTGRNRFFFSKNETAPSPLNPMPMTIGALDLLKVGSAPPAILETLPGRDNEGVPGAWKELESTRTLLLTDFTEPEWEPEFSENPELENREEEVALESENLEFFIVLEDEEEEELLVPFTELELLILLPFDTSLLLVPAGFVTPVESLELLLRNPKFLKLLPALDDMMVCARRIRPSGVQEERVREFEMSKRKIQESTKNTRKTRKTRKLEKNKR